eukprot:scaffold77328_cov22-Cyclotella_meneghiniana.AAC.2
MDLKEGTKFQCNYCAFEEMKPSINTVRELVSNDKYGLGKLVVGDEVIVTIKKEEYGATVKKVKKKHV